MVRRDVAAIAFGLAMVGIVGISVHAIPPVNTVQWVGAMSGEWNDPNAWKNLTTGAVGDATTILLSNRGSEGMNNINPSTTAARHIVIGGGATVDYNLLITPQDFRLRQGTTMTIKDGATWVQDASDHPAGNGWGRMDPSRLIIDNGTFRRSGEPQDGAGAGPNIFGSFNDDNNQPRLGTLPPRVNVDIKNGGRFENTGQLWFGTDGESSPNLRVTFTINNGHMDLTGGATAPVMNGELPFVQSDLAFFYDYSENPNVVGFHNEELQINFTGPGSITVDSAGIGVYRQDDQGIWSGGTTPLSYKDLWDQGILKANGLSGKMGQIYGDGLNPHILQPANFDNFFTVTGTPGQDNYKLTAKDTTTLPTVEWVGGASGEWNDPNAWKNTKTGVVGDALTILGDRYGSEGMNNIDPALSKARHIVIGGGATVEFNGQTANNNLGPRGFRMRQGTTLTIKEGATWIHDQSDYDPAIGAQECRCDFSELILDGGTFRRTGESMAGEGGGNAIFGSYNDDNNQPRLGTLPPRVNVVIKNGGRLENTGQLWFGTDGESSPNLRTSVTIDNGHIDATGGDTAPIENSNEFIPLTADLVFFYDNSENPNVEGAHNEQHEINFIGPGSITVDHTGIFVYRQDTDGIWNTGATQSSYQDLWDMGILKANGLSGKMGQIYGDGTNPHILQPANFSDFFMVTGAPGMDNYTLTSLIESATPPGLAGDYNNDGAVNAADYVVWRNGDSPDDTQAGYNLWRANFGRTAASGSAAGSASAAVPEPSTLVLLALATFAATWRRRS